MEPTAIEISVEGLGDKFLMLPDDAQRLRSFAPSDTPYVFFLPSLDPYTSWDITTAAGSWQRSIAPRYSTARGTPCQPSGPTDEWWVPGDGARTTA